MFLCFPGDAAVQVSSRGRVPLEDLREGDEVLVERRAGELVYEPVLGFLHAVSGKPSANNAYLTVTHSLGELRLSATHMVFVADAGMSGRSDKLAAELEVGDNVFAVALGSSDTIAPSKVLAIRHDAGSHGMYAPLTPSGSVVVDGVVASNYAAPPTDAPLSHGAAHEVFFPVRIYSKLRSWLSQAPVSDEVADEVHAFIRVVYQDLRLGVFHRLLSASQFALQSVF